MNTKNKTTIGNALIGALYWSVVGIGKAIVWTIRLLTGQEAREASLKHQRSLYITALDYAENGDGDMVQCLIGQGSPAYLMPGIDTADLVVRYEAIRDAHQAERQARALRGNRQPITVRIPLSDTRQADATRARDEAITNIIDVANDTKTVLTIVDGGKSK